MEDERIMPQLLFQRRARARLLWLAALLTLTAIPAPSLGQESSLIAPRGADQSLESLRDQVRKEIEKYEAQIAKVDADITKLKLLLEARKSESEDNDANVTFANNARQELAQLSEAKIRFQAKLADLQASAAAMATREKTLQSEIESERSMIKQLIERIDRERGSRKELPPLTNAAVKVYSLAHAAPQELAQVIDSIFSPAQLRLSIDDRTKSLVVMGDKESLEIVEALLMKMDQPADGAADGRTASPAAANHLQARSLLLRVFWLADGLAEGEGQNPAVYLPQSVLEALKRLGLQSPQLVTQTVNSLAARDGAEVGFATQVPAVLLGQHATLNCTGSMSPMDDDHVGVDVDIRVSGPAINCELKGSLATPQGHYMVLGTANSVIAEPMAMGGGAMMGGGGFVGEGGFEMADPAAAVPGAEGGMGRGMEGTAPQSPKYNTSRFAFVVQVIEGESFPAEK
jgi:type II secretory pathway component GspD/PulD (secretin)